MSTDVTHPQLAIVRQNMDCAEVVELGDGTAVVYSTRHPMKERDNEDAAAVIPISAQRGLIAVADGMGGHPGGEDASALAIQSLIRCGRAAGDGDQTLRAVVLDAFEKANDAVTALGVGAATTLAVVEIDGALIRPYHAGDSMILVAGQRGKIKMKTVSHSPVGYAVEAGLLDEADAMHHQDRHLVSNMVGSPDLRIEIGATLALRPRDTVVLASDGLFDNLHIEEIVDLIRTGPLTAVAANLAHLATQRMTQPRPDHPSKPDDMTFVVYRRRK